MRRWEPAREAAVLRREDVLEAMHQEFEERPSVWCMAIVVLEQPRASGAAHGRMDLGRAHREVDGELGVRPGRVRVRQELERDDHVLRFQGPHWCSILANRESR